MKSPICGPITFSNGRFSGATTWTSTLRARKDAATSRPMKLAPITTARFADFARSMNGTEAIAQALEAMLSAANFLYRIEYDATPSSTAPHALSGYELASRLSYLHWSSMPDAALLMQHSDEAYAYANRYKRLIPEGGGASDAVVTLLSNPSFVLAHVLTHAPHARATLRG